MAASSNPISFSTTTLYDAVEGLRDMAISAYSVLESPGDLVELRDELGRIRERADAIQNAVVGFITSIENNL